MFKYETDSRKVKKGQIFIAIKGFTCDGHDYINQAIENGASKIICEKDINIDIPYLKVKDTNKYLKTILNKEYKDKIKKLNIIGITGTNGKTTSCFLIYQMLNMMDIKCSYIGTLGYYYENNIEELQNTTPDILTLYKLLINSLEKGITTIVMEVSSQALSYDRLHGIKFNLIAFTNFTEDHLDYHKTMENYLKAKLKILNHITKDTILILNHDDKYHKYFINENNKVLTIGNKADYKIIKYKFKKDKTILYFKYNNKKYKTKYKLVNKFNIYNYLIMFSIVNQINNNIKKIIKESKYLKAPKGRCELYKVKNGYAIIDYAHTPDAVKKIIGSYKEIGKGKIITVIGCGGNRDKNKRPIMANISSELSDYVILTSDNPREEKILDIINDMIKGIKKDNYVVIENRKDAIEYGIKLIKRNDYLLILGKGHETYQIIGKEKIYLDDCKIVLENRKR